MKLDQKLTELRETSRDDDFPFFSFTISVESQLRGRATGIVLLFGKFSA